MFRDLYFPGDVVETGLSEEWECHHSATIVGSVRQSRLKEDIRPYCLLNPDYVWAPGRDLWVNEYTPAVGDTNPEIECSAFDANCDRRIRVKRTFRMNEYSCEGLPALSLSNELFVPYATGSGFEDDPWPEETIAVDVISVCVLG